MGISKFLQFWKKRFTKLTWKPKEYGHNSGDSGRNSSVFGQSSVDFGQSSHRHDENSNSINKSGPKSKKLSDLPCDCD